MLPDGRFLVTERNPGHLRVGTAEGELSEPLNGIPEVYSFVGETPRTQGGLPETGELWAADHGPEGGDRVDRIEAGQNYGWPFIAGGPDYSGAPLGVGLEHEGMVSPIHVFEETVAPSGLVIYDGDLFAEWQGDLLIGGLQAEGIVRVRIDGDQVVDEERIALDRRIRDIQVANDGSLWLITEHEDGEVLRLTAADDVTGTIPPEEEPLSNQ